MAFATDHLLRTLAAVSPRSRVLDLGCGAGHRAEPLAQLGFDLYACDLDDRAVDRTRIRLSPYLAPDALTHRVAPLPHLQTLAYPDASFDWVVAADILNRARASGILTDLLGEIRRVLAPGGWLYVVVAAPSSHTNGHPTSPLFTVEDLADAMMAADLAVAQDPRVVDDPVRPLIQAIYRRVDPGTPR